MIVYLIFILYFNSKLVDIGLLYVFFKCSKAKIKKLFLIEWIFYNINTLTHTWAHIKL